MSLCQWAEEDWKALLYAIRKGKCILMVGPETALVNGGEAPQLLSDKLAKLLLEDMEGHVKENIDGTNLMEVAKYYCLQRNHGRTDLQFKIKDFYNQCQGEVYGDFHRNLAALPFSLAIHSSPDRMFETALVEQQKKPRVGWYNFRQKRSQMESMGTPEEPLLFYLYGSVQDEDSLVITENDLLDFLISITVPESLPLTILNELQAPDKSFLFLGFGFKHWYLRILLHIMKIKNKENRSFALEDFTPASMAEFKSTVLFYRDGPCNIHFFQKGFAEFATELRERYAAYAPEGTATIPVYKERQPRVFICHASEDKPVAAALYEQLKEAGFEPWLDKENLRGGDAWDKIIQRVIKKEIDYFLVLQSLALQKKAIGYVNLEISEALERKKSFRSGIRFIIPLQIEECTKLDELEDLQTIPVQTKEQIADLIRLIDRDFKKREN